MSYLLLFVPGLALAILGAHFYRAAAWPLVFTCGVLLVLMLTQRRKWVAWLVQASLWAGACVWLWTACLFVQQRMALDQPWLRLAFILGAVALFTLGSTLVFRTARLRARYAPG